MRKKKTGIMVLVCLLLFGIMAIGSGSTGTDDKKEIITSDENVESGNVVSEDDSEVVMEESSTDITIGEQVLVDQDGIVITAMEYTTDAIFGDGIKLLIENNSEKNVTIGCKALVVNDYMLTDLFAADIAAGKKSNEIMYLSSSELEAAGIESVGQIEVYFQIFNGETYEEIFTTDVVTIQTSDYANMDTTPNDVGTELYNAGGIRIVGKAVEENSFWGKAILLYIENSSGENVGVQCDNMSINGFMMTPYFSCDVYDGKKSISGITILSTDLEKNGIESIEDVELQFHIYNVDTFNTIVDSDPITFSAQ